VLSSLCALGGVLGGAVLGGAVLGGDLAEGARPDGPAPCTAGYPAHALHGSCGTYGGANTYYGTYGPGFPTAVGWGLCAWAPATGGWYPSPSYGYVLTDPPAGASTKYLDALGFAMSEGTLDGFWGQTLAWSPDDAAVAAKLYYDALAWSDPIPTVSPGISNAFANLYATAVSAVGATGTPVLTASLPGGATSFTGSTTIHVRLAFPGSGRALAGIPLSFTLSNATFDATHASSATATTDANGAVSLGITASSPTATTVTFTSSGQVGQLGTSFYRPSQPYALDAQDLAAPLPGTSITGTDTWTSNAPPPALGTISITKSGDDEPYLPIAGATFDIMSGTAIADTLTVDTSGSTPESAELPVGSYTVHEATAPPGYLPVPDTPVTVTANQNTLVNLTGANGDAAITASLALRKVDDHTGAPLAGATFELQRDPAGNGSWVEVGTCTTDATGACVPPGGSALLPGYYRVIETQAPPGFLVNPPDGTQDVELAPGETTTVTFADDAILTTLYVSKDNANEPGEGIPGAVYDLYVVGTPPRSTPPSPLLGTAAFPGLHFYAEATTDAGGHLGFTIPVGYRWCVSERSAPADFVLDPALRCTATINATTPDPVRTVAVAETPRLITLEAYKFNVADPGEVIAGATYALFVEGAFPTGFAPPSTPPSVAVPAGDELFAIGTTDALGQLRFSVPSGYAWCLSEVGVPAGYVLDPGIHCTSVLDASTPALAAIVALPELAMTGSPLGALVLVGVVMVGIGALLAASRRRRRA
jgi:LPXTG-motif cell wall-anchored protein